MLSLDLTGRLALVTGATGDLGREIAATLAEAGADVAVHYFQNRAFADELVSQIRAKGVRSAAFQADVGDESSVFAMRDRVFTELGIVDIIVANAVQQYAWKPILEQPIQDYESQFRTCVLQAVCLSKAFLPGLIEAIEAGQRESGRFIAINTECAMQCFESQSAYAAGKRGLDGFVRVLAREVGPTGITVNQVAPGWMISRRDRTGAKPNDEAYASRVPLKRRGTDRDVAQAVAFLASEMASFITGTYLPVSGGNVMPGI